MENAHLWIAEYYANRAVCFWDTVNNRRRYYRLLRVVQMAGSSLLALLSAGESARAANPILGIPIHIANTGAAQLSLTNCSDTNFLYVIQISSNLLDWDSFSTNLPTSPANPITVPLTNAPTFYRLEVIPHVSIPLFQFAVVVKSNFSMIGGFTTVDSYDSTSPLFSVAGQYTPVLRKSNGNVGTASPVIGALAVGDGTIYGQVMTGAGTQLSAAQIGPSGVVGDTAWISGQNGMEPGHWSGGFNLNIPDVSPPAVGITTLPAPNSNGVVTLNGGNYTILPNDPGLGYSLNVTAPTTLWVQGSYSAPGITVNTNTGGRLFLYVGTNGGSGDSLNFGGVPVNYPGIPVNLQIYGLPSVTSLSLNNNYGFTGVVCAPEAIASIIGKSTNYTSGAFIFNALSLIGYGNVHFDESLLTNGPVL